MYKKNKTLKILFVWYDPPTRKPITANNVHYKYVYKIIMLINKADLSTYSNIKLNYLSGCKSNTNVILNINHINRLL